MYLVSPEKLHPLGLAPAEVLTLQRACKQLDWLTRQITALQNQIIALDRTIWLGGWPERLFGDPFSPVARWVRQHYYDPTRVGEAGPARIRQAWQASQLDPQDAGNWADGLVELADQVLTVYGQPSTYVDFAAFQAEAQLKQKWLTQFEADRDHLRLELIRPLYRQLHPERHLETLYGLGQDSAAVFLSFVGLPNRFPDGRAFRGWSGLTPRSAQSGSREAKGLPISQAGPNLVKKYAFLDANVARRYDPQLAKIYYDQMVHKGQHHTQAVCAVATHLLDRVYVILKHHRPYQLRDVDGTPITPEQARQIIADHYTVPDEVRQRNHRRARREQTDHQAERRWLRQAKQEGKSASTLRG